MTITTDGGTVFRVDKRHVTITRSDQPEAVIPLADLLEFLHLYEIEEDEGGDPE